MDEVEKNWKKAVKDAGVEKKENDMLHEIHLE